MITKHYVTPPRGIALKFEGIIDMKELYRQMKLWLEDKGYAKEDTIEKSYVEKVKPEGKQIEILWEGGKTVSDYIKYKINVTFLFLNTSEVEVQRENIKIKLYKGSFQIFIVGIVEEGGKEWESLGPFRKLYHNLIAKRRTQDYLDGLYRSVYSFQDSIRKFLEIRT